MRAAAPLLLLLASAFTLAAAGSMPPFVVKSSAYATRTLGSQASSSTSVIGRSETLTASNSKRPLTLSWVSVLECTLSRKR